MFLNTTIVFMTLLIGRLTYALTSSSSFVVPFWPLSGITVYLYLKYGRRILPGAFVGLLLLTTLFTQRPVWMCVIISLGNCLEPILAAIIFKRLNRARENLGPFLELFATGVIAFLTPLPTSIVSSYLISHANGLSFQQGVQFFIAWWLGHFIGILIFVPLLRDWERRKAISSKEWFHFIWSSLLLTGIAFLIFWTDIGSYYLFLIFPVLLLSSLLLPKTLLYFQGILLQTIAIVANLLGQGITSDSSKFAGHISLQFFLSMLSLTVIALASFAWKDIRKRAIITLLLAWFFGGVSYGFLRAYGGLTDVSLVLFTSLVTLLSLFFAGFVHHLENIESESRNLLFRVMNAVPVGIFRCDAQGRLSVFNREWALITEQSSDDISGKNWLESIHPEDREQLREQLQSSSLREKPFQGDIRILKPDGETRIANLILVCEHNEGLSEPAFLGTIQDVTEQKTAESLVNMQRAMVIHAAKLSSLGEMAGSIAHEVNNPLAIIHAQSHLMRSQIQKGQLDAGKLLTSLRFIEETIFRISRVTRGLLEYSQIDTIDRMVRQPLATTVADTLDLCRERFRANGILLELGNIPDIGIEFKDHQLKQVLMGLLNNAFDAVKNMGDRWIQLEFAQIGTFIEITVTDSGKPIPEPIQERMFEPFFTSKDSKKGAGLGLSIARSIMEENGGYLLFDPTARHTRFQIGIPMDN